MKIKFKKLISEAKVPTKGTPGSACYDIYAAEDKLLKKGVVTSVRTGFAMEVPEWYCYTVYSRSSMFLKRQIATTPLVIDSDYRGEILISLLALDADYQVKKGDRIAQFKREEAYDDTFVLADDLSETVRGAGGYGSTGR